MKLKSWTEISTMHHAQVEQKRQTEQRASDFFDVISKNDIQALKHLLKKGTPSYIMLGQRTALMIACEYNAIECAKLLIQIGVPVGYQDETGRDALIITAEKHHNELFDLILLQGPKLKRVFDDNSTALICATKAQNVYAVAQLVKYANYTVNEYDKYGRTALWHVLSKPELTNADNDIARILLDEGANPDAMDIEGVSPKNAAQALAAQALVEQATLMQEIPEIAPEPTENAPKRKNTLSL